MDIVRDRIVAGVVLNPQGETLQTFAAAHVAAPLGPTCARLEDVPNYGRLWREIRALVAGPRQGLSQRFHTRVDSVLFHTEGDQNRVIEPGEQHAVVWWRGLTGDYANVDERWDFFARPNDGTTVVFSGGADFVRTGMIVRTIIANAPWMLPGYSAAWKMVWMREALRGL
jgi:hypothetical protein